MTLITSGWCTGYTWCAADAGIEHSPLRTAGSAGAQGTRSARGDTRFNRLTGSLVLAVAERAAGCRAAGHEAHGLIAVEWKQRYSQL